MTDKKATPGPWSFSEEDGGRAVITSPPSAREQDLESALRELVEAFERRWEGESERARGRYVSPRMEDALAAANMLLGKEPE